MKTGQSAKQKFAGERKESLREYLKARGHDQHAFDLIMQLQDLKEELGANEVNRLRIALDGHFKFLNKYLPDMKAYEVTVDRSGEQSAEDHIKAIGEVIDIRTSRAKMAS